MGDSHALSWFPAVNRLAIDRGWRLVNLDEVGLRVGRLLPVEHRTSSASTPSATGGARTRTGASRRSSRTWS